jgi:hypothetical protein
VRGLVGELLGDDPAEGGAGHVDLLVAERVEHAFCRARDAGHPPRPGVGGGLPGAGRVEADRLQATGGQFALEWRAEIQACPQAGDQQQRPAGSADRGAQPEPVGADVDEPDGPAVRRRRWYR